MKIKARKRLARRLAELRQKDRPARRLMKVLYGGGIGSTMVN